MKVLSTFHRLVTLPDSPIHRVNLIVANYLPKCGLLGPDRPIKGPANHKYYLLSMSTSAWEVGISHQYDCTKTNAWDWPSLTGILERHKQRTCAQPDRQRRSAQALSLARCPVTPARDRASDRVAQ